MKRIFYTGFVGALGFSTLMGCAPPGYENAAFTKVKWPTQDQSMTLDQRIEIEGRLKALKYLSEPADGVLTRNSRRAIRAFQTDIGAPSTGVISIPLLDALQTNTGFLSAAELKRVNRGAIIQAPQKRPVTVPAPTPASTSSSSSSDSSGGGGGESGGGGGSGGGSGGSGAGAWN